MRHARPDRSPSLAQNLQPGAFGYTGVGIVRVLRRPHVYRSRVRIQRQRCCRRQLTQLTFPQVTAIPVGGVSPYLRFHEPWCTQPARQRPTTGISAGQGPFVLVVAGDGFEPT